jgi:hypothetical protein
MAGYKTIAAMRAYWADQGYVVPDGTTDEQLSPAWNRGASVIDRYEPRFSGTRTAGYQQAHAFPRNGATTYYGEAIPDGETPEAIAQASFEAAWLDYKNPGILSPVITGSSIAKRKKVGSLEIEYAASTATDVDDLVKLATPVVTTIEGLLWMFMTPVLPAIMVV